jgi:ATP-dependent helicase/nuclease subunit B
LPVELLISPPAAGKTQACIERIKNVQSSHPFAKIWVLVPDNQKAVYFRQRLADAGGGIGITIGTFRSLYMHILEENGIFVPVITPALEHRLVQESVDAAADALELSHYASIKHKPGFILALQDAFAELRGALVRPGRFLEYTQNSAPAPRELAMLYSRFLTRLQALNWIDQEGQSWLAVSALEGNAHAAGEFRLVVVDGFTSFTGARRQFLQLLSEQVGEMLITLPGKQNSNRPVHRRSLAVIEDLFLELSPRVSEIQTAPHLPEVILHLEQHVLDPYDFRKLESQKPVMLEARSQSEEAREVLRWVKELNVRQHIPLNDCAVFAGNLEMYQPFLKFAAKEFGIKIHFSQPDPLAESPAVLAMLTMLTLPLEDYPTRMLLNTLHSPYFDFGLDAIDVENLEMVSQQAIIVKGREQWDAAWRMLEKSALNASQQLDDERQRNDYIAGIDLPALRDTLEYFWGLYSRIDLVRSLSAWVEWLENLLATLSFYDNISSERDWEACISLGDVLKALVISESVAGIRPVDYARFLTDLLGGLNGARLKEPGKLRHNAVMAGRMVEARASRFKAVALIGFSEGLFPVIENPDPFLDEELRKNLGIEPRLQRQQASIFYQALTRADTHLLITRPYLSDDGEAWEASPYWLSAKKLFTDESLKKINPGAVRSQADAASVQELLFWGIQQGDMLYSEDDELVSRWQDLEKARGILNARRSKKARGAYEGYVEQVAPILAGLYSPEQTWSASRLEEYGTCPHKFYISTTLKLIAKEPPELGLDAAQLGSIYHRILELVYQEAGSPGDTQQLMDLLEDVAAGIFLKAPFVYGFRPSPLWEVEKGHLVETLRQTIQALQETSQGWTPFRFEQKFGLNNHPALAVEIGSESIQLRGVIDRVDQNYQGQIRVLDYKTGGSNLEKADLISGRRLQIPIYALAAQDALHLGEVVEGFYWKINEAKASSFKLSKYAGGPLAAYSLVIAHIKRILSGIRSGEFPPVPPKGGCPDYCPAVQWCWRYQSGY